MEKKHVHETNPWRTAIALIFFVLIIVIGLITIQKPRLNYALTPQQTVKMAVKGKAVFYPYELEDVINGANDTVVLIDIRDKFTFGQGHIPGAENISALALLDEDNIRRLTQFKNDGVAVVIYDNNQLSANGPWMVFQQLGFDNVRILLGGYNYYADWQNKLGESQTDSSYLNGISRYDFEKVAKSSVTLNNSEQSETKSLNIRRRKKTTAVEGGC